MNPVGAVSASLGECQFRARNGFGHWFADPHSTDADTDAQGLQWALRSESNRASFDQRAKPLADHSCGVRVAGGQDGDEGFAVPPAEHIALAQAQLQGLGHQDQQRVGPWRLAMSAGQPNIQVTAQYAHWRQRPVRARRRLSLQLGSGKHAAAGRQARDGINPCEPAPPPRQPPAHRVIARASNTAGLELGRNDLRMSRHGDGGRRHHAAPPTLSAARRPS
jgi:hypothetical protein